MGGEGTLCRNPLCKLGGWGVPPGSWLKENVTKSGIKKKKIATPSRNPLSPSHNPFYIPKYFS